MKLDWAEMQTKKKPLGRRSPWVWSVELVRGCNLSCWHCTARIFPEDGQTRFMSKATWEAMCRVMAVATPCTRLELAQGGEPTLHPELLDFLAIARKITPTTQIQVTSNGVTMSKGEITLEDIFEAGAHSVYVDMYGSREKFIDKAKATGAGWYLYNEPKTGTPEHKMANTYYGDPNMKLVILQDTPVDRIKWRKFGRLSTFLNHIDWTAAMPYGLTPVREPYERKCTLPMRYVSLSYEGDYLFCCIDFWCESAGTMFSVHDGVEGFKKYWFGRPVQSIRRRLGQADRASVPYCSRCNCAFSKCDWIKIWPEGSFDSYWDGQEWHDLPPKEHDIEVFADAWAKANALKIPSRAEERECLEKSTKRIISSTAAVAPKKAKTTEKKSEPKQERKQSVMPEAVPRTGTNFVLPRYPVYVPTKNRSERCLTAKFLIEDGVPFYLVVEPQNYDAYAAKFGESRLLVLPFDDPKNEKGEPAGSMPARNWIREHSIKAGFGRHWQIDDNIRHVERRYQGKRLRMRSGIALRAIEDFTDRYENVGLSGMNYSMFVPDRDKFPPFQLNCHIYSATLSCNKMPYKWRLRYNEDTDLCLQVLAGGLCTLAFNAFLVKKMTTMLMKGGNTDKLYKGTADGRLIMSKTLERMWPGVVRTGRRFRRPQHIVFDGWKRFDTPLIKKPDLDIPAGPNEYGMTLTAQQAIQGEELKELFNEYHEKEKERP